MRPIHWAIITVATLLIGTCAITLFSVAANAISPEARQLMDDAADALAGEDAVRLQSLFARADDPAVEADIQRAIAATPGGAVVDYSQRSVRAERAGAGDASIFRLEVTRHYAFEDGTAVIVFSIVENALGAHLTGLEVTPGSSPGAREAEG